MSFARIRGKEVQRFLELSVEALMRLKRSSAHCEGEISKDCELSISNSGLRDCESRFAGEQVRAPADEVLKVEG